MRISDWSSDVCSSDLSTNRRRLNSESARSRCKFTEGTSCRKWRRHRSPILCAWRRGWKYRSATLESREETDHEGKQVSGGNRGRRSEEHTSELQSLMRISYAVFCLKKKKKKDNNIDSINVLNIKYNNINNRK